MTLPVMPSTHRWFRGGPGLSKVGRNALFASDDTSVWVWDEETGNPVTDLRDETGAAVSAPRLSDGWLLGAGLPNAVRVASFSLGKNGKRYALEPANSLALTQDAQASAASSASSASSSASSAASSAALVGAPAGSAIDAHINGGTSPAVRKGDLVLNVKDYGATGDGTTDDRAAIQSALDAARTAGGGTVLVPLGTFIVGSYLRLGSNTSLRGAGFGSVLKLKGGAPNTAASDILHNYNLDNGFGAQVATPGAPTITYLAGSGSLAAATYSYRVSAVNAQGETLASTAATGTASAGSARMQVSWTAVTGATGYNVFGRVAGSEQLLAENVTSPWVDDGSLTPAGLVSDFNYTSTRATTQDTNISVESLTLDGNAANNPALTASAGIAYFNNVDGLAIRGVRVRDSKRHGLSMTWCSNFTLEGNVVTGCGYGSGFTGLMLYYQNSKFSVTGNTVTACGFGILTDHYTNDGTVSGNTCSANSDSGIGFDEGSSRISATGNTCTGNGNIGIAVTDGQTGRRTYGITLAGNTCTGNTNEGIVLGGVDYFTVTGNTLTGNAIGLRTVGVTQKCRRGTITGNTCSNNNAQGIYLAAGTQNVTVEGNRCTENTSHGIELLSANRCDIKQNTAANNNRSNGGGFVCGIKVSGTTADNVVVGNTCTNDVSTFGQHAGIYLAGTTNTGTRYGGNVVFNNKSNQFFSDTPANDIALTY